MFFREGFGQAKTPLLSQEGRFKNHASTVFLAPGMTALQSYRRGNGTVVCNVRRILGRILSLRRVVPMHAISTTGGSP